MTDVTTALNDLFNVLFYGSGAWLGLLLMLLLIFGLIIKYPKAGLLMLPVTVFLGINYLNNDLGWHGLIMFLTSTFIMFDFAYSAHKHKL